MLEASNSSAMQPSKAELEGQLASEPSQHVIQEQPEGANPGSSGSAEEIQTPAEASIDAEAERAIHRKLPRKPIVSIDGRDVCDSDQDEVA